MSSKHPHNCCEAINNAIGLFYENRARIAALRSPDIEERFRYCPDNLATRSLLIFAFLRDLTTAVLAQFALLSNADNCSSICCASAAAAIERIGSAYVTDIFTAVGSPAFTNAVLTSTIIPGLVTGYTNALAAVVLQFNCDNGCGCGCDSHSSCKTKHKK